MFKYTLVLLSLLSGSVQASQAIGFYSNGKLKDSSNVNTDSQFIKLFYKREKNFTTQEMHLELNKLSNLINRMYPGAEKIQVGDLSAQFGGKATRHKSHQNGLDADIVYLRHNGFEQAPTNPEWAEYFVKSSKVSMNFHKVRNWYMLDYLAHNTDANRIFVDRAIKAYYCKEKLNSEKYTQKELKRNIATLRLLRPAKYHKTHLHLRLKCPKGDTKCKDQAAVPGGSGCNSLHIINTEVN